MNTETKKVFIAGLRKNTTELELITFLSQRVDIINLIFKKKAGNQKLCIGYAILKVSNNDAQSLFKKSLFFNGRIIKFLPHLEGKELQNHLTKLNSRRILIKNLPKTVTNKKLMDYFTQFGEIENAYISNRQSNINQNKFRGYVIFKCKKSALKAIKQTQKLLEGKIILCSQIHKNTPKDNRSDFSSDSSRENQKIYNKIYLSFFCMNWFSV